jgi:chemotaxis protein CheD
MTSSAPAAVRTIYLQPGQIAVGTECHILTILGSCVAVCLQDTVRNIGGMNHYLLPRGPRDATTPRFADVAMPQLLARVLAEGASRGTLEAKVFGGARILAARAGARDLGAENAAAAVSFLEAEGIPIVARDTGGTRSRKLILQTNDGVVWLKTF